MAHALTSKTVENLKANPDKRQEIPDPALSGLYIVVQPTGKKSWALRYRYAGKPKKLTLGRWPMMTLALARIAASEAIEAIEIGQDPSAAKIAAKTAKMDAQLSGRDTVKSLVEQFDKRHLSKLKSRAEARRFLERFPVAVWGERDIHSITKRDVIDLLDEIVDSGRATTANRVLAHTRKFFNWCRERDILTSAPTDGVKAPAIETSRDRYLTDQEIVWFWQACDCVGEPWGPMAKMLLLTGQRRGEVAKMTYAEISDGNWHLTRDRTKNNRAHDVPLSASAMAVLADVTRTGSAPYVLTTNGVSPVQGFSKARERIHEAMVEIAQKEILRWTFHDLRRTAATGMARLGIPVTVTEAAINHVSGTRGGIVSIYQVHDYAPEKREALEAWGRYVDDLVDGVTDNVVQLGAEL